MKSLLKLTNILTFGLGLIVSITTGILLYKSGRFDSIGVVLFSLEFIGSLIFLPLAINHIAVSMVCKILIKRYSLIEWFFILYGLATASIFAVSMKGFGYNDFISGAVFLIITIAISLMVPWFIEELEAVIVYEEEV